MWYAYGDCCKALNCLLTGTPPLLFCFFRGFRQATRGPDTGAFQHPLFRRDRPELCLQMVCQRTSPNAEKKKKQQQQQQQSSSSRLPAKKRHVLLTKESLDAMTEEQAKQASQNIPITSTAEAPTRGADMQPATVSEDSLSNASSDHQQQNPRAVRLGRVITNDAALTQKALAVRNEEERMRVARAMLYDAYQQALRGER